jgi:hypothetical protein
MWSNPYPGRSTLKAFIGMIEPILITRNLFNVREDSLLAIEYYVLRGMVCYTPNHYISAFFNTDQQYWVIYNDESLTKQLTWKSLRRRLLLFNYRPVLLFYESNDVYTSAYN